MRQNSAQQITAHTGIQMLGACHMVHDSGSWHQSSSLPAYISVVNNSATSARVPFLTPSKLISEKLLCLSNSPVFGISYTSAIFLNQDKTSHLVNLREDKSLSLPYNLAFPSKVQPDFCHTVLLNKPLATCSDLPLSET